MPFLLGILSVLGWIGRFLGGFFFWKMIAKVLSQNLSDVVFVYDFAVTHPGAHPVLVSFPILLNTVEKFQPIATNPASL